MVIDCVECGTKIQEEERTAQSSVCSDEKVVLDGK
jgi:Zn ribbon nucleic-acid-binding protein